MGNIIYYDNLTPSVSTFYRDGNFIGRIQYNAEGGVDNYTIVDDLLSVVDEETLKAATNDAAKIKEVLRKYTRSTAPSFITYKG
jgi:hypothetical protein